jgi:hypothetical protein
MHDSDRLVHKFNLVALLRWDIVRDAHVMEFDMTIVTKWASIATVGISLGMPLLVPSFADPVSSSTVIPSRARIHFSLATLFDCVPEGLR